MYSDDKKITSSGCSGFTQRGIGVPQYRLRETDQSRASFSQLWNRCSFTQSGTLEFVFCQIEQKRSTLIVPVGLGIVCKELVSHFFHTNEPTWYGLINKWRFGSVVKLVLVLLCMRRVKISYTSNRRDNCA